MEDKGGQRARWGYNVTRALYLMPNFFQPILVWTLRDSEPRV